MKLPQAPDFYDRDDQDALRAALEVDVSKLQQLPTGWVQATGTATRATFDTATVTTAQLAERVKAMLDDVILRVKS
jgi:hypothetical protein